MASVLRVAGTVARLILCERTGLSTTEGARVHLTDTIRGHLWSVHALLRPGAPPAVAPPERMAWRGGHVVRIARAPRPGERRWVVGLHGLGATPGSGLMRRAGAQVVARGWGWLALGVPWCPERGLLHHYPDVLDLIDAARADLGAQDAPYALLGMSLGGAVALRAAADPLATPHLTAAVALCPPLDPEAARHALHHHITLWPYQRLYLSWLRALDAEAPPPARPDATTRALATARTLADWERATGTSPAPLKAWWPPPTSRPTLTLATRHDPLIRHDTLAHLLTAHPDHTLRLSPGGHLAFPGGMEAAVHDALDWLNPQW